MENPRRLISTGASLLRRRCRTKVPPEIHGERVVRLCRRLCELGDAGESAAVAEALKDYSSRKSRFFAKHDLQNCVTVLRKYRRYQLALEVMKWFGDAGFNLSNHDYAVQLYLISLTKGIDDAEKYFHGLSPSAKNSLTYTALLNSYCKKKMLEEALTLFEEMDRLGFASTSLAFSHLINLYMRLGQPEKVPPLFEELKQRKIFPTTYTYNALMHSYALLNDIESVERVVEEMRKDDESKCKWTTHCHLASIYVNAGLYKKAELSLKMLEQEMRPRDLVAFHYLISLYAATSNQYEVKRMWNSLKILFETPRNSSYLVMLRALAKLKNVRGMRKCFREWESCLSHFDMRLPEAAVRAYLNWDMIKEAERVFGVMIKRSSKPTIRIQEMFMDFFLTRGQMDLALRHMEEAVSQVTHKWHPDPEIVIKFLNRFEEEKDVNGAEKLCKMLKEVNCLDSKAYELLLRTYVAAGEMVPGMRRRLEEDEIEISSELEILLDSVCP